MTATAHGEKLTRKQEQFIAALLTASTILEAAQAVGISESTALRWMKEAAFAAEYRTARRAVLEDAQAELHRISLEAVETLQRNLAPSAPPAVQVRAALGILEHARAVEMEEILERLAKLEALVAGQITQPTRAARRLA
jgi:phage terminase small subunit